MVTGYETRYYNDISRICNYLQNISQDLESIKNALNTLAEKHSEKSKWVNTNIGNIVGIVENQKNLTKTTKTLTTNSVRFTKRNRNESAIKGFASLI